MKKIYLIFIFYYFVSIGCKKPQIEKEIRIDIGTLFQNEFVVIKLDNKVVFSGIANTSMISGVAEILIFNYPIGRHKISVAIDEKTKVDYFRHKRDFFIYIAYNKNKSDLDIKYPKQKYKYD